MVNFMVALDPSENSKAAFYNAVVLLDKKCDHLFLITIVSDMTPYFFGVHGLPPTIYQETQERIKKDASKLLHKYGNMCDKAGIPHSLLLGVSPHAGEMITQAVDQKKIDFLIMGRRGMGKIKRLFVGSTSKYCVEHCNCNVLIVKGDWAPPEEHADLKQIVKLEEQERHRRMDEKDELAEDNAKKIEHLMIDYFETTAK